MDSSKDVERQTMDVDIVGVGFGPAMGGFLTTLARAMADPNSRPVFASRAMPGMPLQVICYERADDIGFGVSGVVTQGRAIRKSFPNLDIAQIPRACEVKHEKVLYLLDPVGASRRSLILRMADKLIRTFKWMLSYRDHAFELPCIPPFLRKDGGLILSIGQFNQWVGSELMSSGTVQIWPGMPVSQAIIEGDRVLGIRLVDQGTDKAGRPDTGYMPGIDIRARLTVVGDGPVGTVSQQLDKIFGLPEGQYQREWAVGMKFVVELSENCPLQAGTVLHTFGYPEPEIFGFLYVYPDRLASLGIFVPASFENPVRTAYRYLQHWMMHPYLWRYLQGSTLRSWGAKSLGESGRRGQPYLVGNGYARIGENSGSTNVLTGSGVDEAWMTGVQLAEGVIELLKANQPFTRENLEKAYVKRRRASWVESEARIAEKARDGFQHGFVAGLIGMGLTGITRGMLNLGFKIKRPYEHIPSFEEYYENKISKDEIEKIRKECTVAGLSLHDAFMDRVGWPRIPYDGKLLISHQDVLLVGGKVQAPPGGYADHVLFLDPALCEHCDTKVCIELCSGQAITTNPEGGVPLFDREKCVYCGACMWNCAKPRGGDPEHVNIEFRTGSGGLHSAEN
ncbi:MAG: 4Fe-4S ferredoxin [Candidatus Omnitrophica bacterium]|nr:4Fe-4S ferredoxin [Candidatus Omnitrophota bacterium]